MQRKALLASKGKSLDSKVTVISPIVKIPSKDDVVAVLAACDESDKEKSLTFIINDDKVKLNQEKIDIAAVINISERDTSVFLSSDFTTPDLTSSNNKFVYEMISKTLRDIPATDLEIFVDYLVRILSCFSGEIRFKIVKTFTMFSKKITYSIHQTLDVIFHDGSKYFRLVDVVICFFGKKSEQLKDQWRTWLNTRQADDYLPFFEKIDEDDCNGLQFFEKSVETSYLESYINPEAERELLHYFYNWLTKQVYDNQERLERNWSKREKSSAFPTEKVSCSICGGYFYRISKKN